jgi:predicted CXXCH cytochrome family protein
MNPNYDRPVHAGFGRVLDYRCVSCHIGNAELEEGADRTGTGWKYPGDIPEGVDCQRCHGPGQAHVAAARAGKPIAELRAGIVNPARLSPERQIDVCMQCHLETTSSPLPGHMVKFDRGVFSYLPGTPLHDWALYFDYEAESAQHQRFDFVSAAYRFRESRCFLESKGAVTCTSCHDAHDARRSEATQRRYSEVCLSCHQAAVDTMVEAKRHPAAADCISCHMPERRASDAPELYVADHRIPRTPIAEAPLESDIAAYRGKVVPYLPGGPPSTPELELYTAVAQVTQDANLAEGAALLDELIRRYSPAKGQFYLAAGDAWRKLGRLDRGGPWLEEAVRRMPADWRSKYSLALALASAGRFDPAVQLLRSASLLAPDEPGPQIELASVLMEQGQAARAVAVGRAAVRIDPSYAESHNALGAVLLQAGDAAGATAALREAVRLRPELPPLRTDLAVVLALTGQTAEANHHFDRALRLDPSFAEGHAAYADSLMTQGKLAQASEHFETALKLDPNQPEARGTLAAILVQLGQPAAAIEQLREAIRITPDYYDAHFALGQMLLSGGERDQAITHLRRASESPDADLREAAQEALRRAQ